MKTLYQPIGCFLSRRASLAIGYSLFPRASLAIGYDVSSGGYRIGVMRREIGGKGKVDGEADVHKSIGGGEAPGFGFDWRGESTGTEFAHDACGGA